MNIIIQFISLIFVCLPLVVHSDGGSSNGPGSSACLYFGDIDTLCSIATVDVGQIPEDCSSIIVTGASVDPSTNTVSLSLTSLIDTLHALLACNKKVFLYYTQIDCQDGWPPALECNTIDGGQKACCEMEGLKAFLDEYQGISGLVLYYLDAGIFPANFSCPTENFKVYLEVMRAAFPELSIGFDLSTREMIDYNFNPIGPWFDFSVLDPLLDFYIVNIFSSRQCSPDLIQIGGFPLTGNYTYTVDKAMSVITAAGIPKEKCIIQFSVGSTSTDKTASPCSLSNTVLCTNPADFCEVCTDSLGTLLEKGKYSKANANGFLIDCIDADDPGGVCCCPSGPFPAFRALLDGFNGADSTQCCPKYEIFGP